MTESTTVQVPLRRRDGSVRAYVTVDSEDAPKVTMHRWSLGSHGYAKRNYRDGGKAKVDLLHRRIMGLEYGDPRTVDHVNRDRLDCRKANMRVGSHAENMQNQPLRSDNKSGYRGVWWDPKRKYWEAYARVNGRRSCLGRYDTAEEAARVAAEFRAAHMPFSDDAMRLAA